MDYQHKVDIATKILVEDGWAPCNTDVAIPFVGLEFCNTPTEVVEATETYIEDWAYANAE